MGASGLRGRARAGSGAARAPGRVDRPADGPHFGGARDARREWPRGREEGAGPSVGSVPPPRKGIEVTGALPRPPQGAPPAALRRRGPSSSPLALKGWPVGQVRLAIVIVVISVGCRLEVNTDTVRGSGRH